MRILVTGAAGFIGFHTAMQLLARGDEVVGVDSLNDYYSPALKEARLERLKGSPGFQFRKLDLADRRGMEEVFENGKFARVIHLGAQAGVRYSISNPHAYVESNLIGFVNVLEGCRHQQIGHLVYASSSSVYGLNSEMPFKVSDPVDHPISLYAATKKSNELMAHTYSHLYGLPTTGLRFFTVYGPWGRPDMAYFKFTEAILAGRPIEVYNQGKMRRDFTYVDDIVEGVIRTCDQVAAANPKWNPNHPDPASSSAPYRLYNIGHSHPVELGEFLEILQSLLGRRAEIRHLPMQPGDVLATGADVTALQTAVGFAPKTDLRAGLAEFVRWYREFYNAV